MRGADRQKAALCSYLSPEAMVASGRPQRVIQPLVKAALERLSPGFDRLYAPDGRSLIAPEKLLRAMPPEAPVLLLLNRPGFAGGCLV